MKTNPNLMALLQGSGGMQVQRGLGGQDSRLAGMDPNLALLLMGSGKMQVRKKLDGSLQMPGGGAAPQGMTNMGQALPPQPAMPAPQQNVDPFARPLPNGGQQEDFSRFFNDPKNAPGYQPRMAAPTPQPLGAAKLDAAYAGAPQPSAGSPTPDQVAKWTSIINTAKAEVASPEFKQRQQDRSVAPFMQGAMEPQKTFIAPGPTWPSYTPPREGPPISYPDPAIMRWSEQMHKNLDGASWTKDNAAVALMGVPAPSTPNIPTMTQAQNDYIKGTKTQSQPFDVKNFLRMMQAPKR